MRTLPLSLSLAFLLLASPAIAAEAQEYVIGVKGMT